MPDAGRSLHAVRSTGQTVDQMVDHQPVIADNNETCVVFRRDGFDLSASYFWFKSNLGSRIQVIGGAGVIQREKTKIRGLELSASYSLPAGTRIGANFAA